MSETSWPLDLDRSTGAGLPECPFRLLDADGNITDHSSARAAERVARFLDGEAAIYVRMPTRDNLWCRYDVIRKDQP